MRFRRLAPLSLALAIFAGACSDAPTGPGPQLELGEVFEEMSLSSILPAEAEMGMPMLDLMPTPSGCSYSASAQSFVCAPITSSGLTITRGYALLTASGTPQASYEKGTTAAVRTTAAVVGRVTEQGMTADIDMQQAMTLSGLLTRAHVLDGTQLLKMTMSMPDHPTMRMTVTTTIAALALPERGTSQKYPKSGTITTSLASDDAAFGTFTITMTFNGTSKVAVRIDDGGTIEQCTIDLAATGPGGSTCSMM